MSPAIDAVLNSRLRKSLQAVERGFLDAISQGSEALDAFVRTWSALEQEIASRKQSSSLDEETIALARIVHSDIAIMGQCFLHVETVTSSLHCELVSETEAIVDAYLQPSQGPSRSEVSTIAVDCAPSQSPRASKPFLQPIRHPSTSPISSALATILPSRTPSSAISVTESSRSASDPNPLPEFIEHAYKYFVANLFNPYPSREDKQAIVDKTDNDRVTLTSVSTWFTNARRRCGWTAILKERCKGSRETMVSLATRIFVKPDPRNPVGPEVEAEFLEMKEAVEGMYERKTRTSAWIEDLDSLDELVNPSLAKKNETEEEREARRREKELRKEQREFEREKRKMQVEALRKAEKVTKQMQRERAKEAKKTQRAVSFVAPYPAQPCADVPVAGGKRKFASEDSESNTFPALRHSSSSSSLSSSISRVPSLSWSDSGDERPYKRNRSSPATPPPSSTAGSPLSPALEIPASFDYSLTFESPEGLNTDPSAIDSLFDFSVHPHETLVTPTTPPRGQKRSHDTEDCEDTPRAKRVCSDKPIVASAEPESTVPPAPSLFTPPPSEDGTLTQTARRPSIQHSFNFDSMLALSDPVHLTAPPDESLPLDVGVFDWSSGMETFNPTATATAGVDPQGDFSQLFRMFAEAPEAGAFALHDQLTPAADDLGEFMGLMSDEALNDMGLDLTGALGVEGPPPTPSDVSRASSVGPAVTATPAELADKALGRERRRRELEEKRAALAREQARLAEMERELDDE